MVLNEGKGISDFLINIKKTLDEIGVDLASGVLEEVDRRVKEDKNRKQDWVVKSKDNMKSLGTVFGEVKYKRTYYENKKTGEYKYLSDELLGIEVHDKMDTSLKSKLIEEAIDSPYRKSGMKASESIEFTGQTVMNAIRYKLQNVRVFSGVYKSSEDLWLEVADYIDEAYEIENIEKIYLSGDGASWITKSVYVLDRFHLSKYVKKATAHLPHLTSSLWNYINRLEKENVIESSK